MINSFRGVLKKCLYATTATALIVLISSCGQKSKYPGPLSPEESMKTFQFAENFKAEIFAAEPLVVDPVTMQFDEEGNAYVVGMLDAYKPDSVKGKGKIVMLKDLNNDGRADTAIVFADSLREASSILPWKGGLLIAAAPNIMYYKDTDGDGRADQKEIIFSGFFTGNEEAQITNLTFGVDNWIYANNTGQAGEVTFNRMPGAPRLKMQGSDFRFRLDRNQFELTTGPGQFGLAIDDWGHRFFTANSLHIREVVAARRYLDRNPYLPSDLRAAVFNISDHDPLMYQISETPYWRQVRTDRRNKDYQENHLDRVEYARDHFTAASGGTFYGGDAFPEEYYGNIFTGDVSGNLVHRDILVATDSTPYYIAQRAEQEKSKEFLVTTDTWFRPANFSVGPDGNLYVIDMYRQHIETPVSIPDDLETDMDFNAGNTMGRIYRIVPQSSNGTKWVKPDLKNATGEQLVAALSHKNQWWRITAQRLLLERQDKTVIPQVKKLFAESSDPRTRLHALYVLEGMDALDAGIVKEALKDPAAGIRENAAILAEKFPACLASLEQLTEDSAIRVAYQATLSLGEYKDKAIIPWLAKTILRHGQSKWFRAAVLSSEAGSSVELLDALTKNGFADKAEDWKTDFYEELAETIGARNQKTQVMNLLQRAAQAAVTKMPGAQAAIVKGLVAGLQHIEGVNDEIKGKLKAITGAAGSDAAKALEDIKTLYSGLTGK
ncbi:MAG: dehydrogenase [Sphingobacteriales bacterium 44-15]|nr:MAG: dehydrogenase [Sphingobacteriales bacterium 44-15]